MCNCNCESNIPCGWDWVPSIYISTEDPLKADGMTVKLKYADNLYLNDKGELCAKAGSGSTDTYTKSEIDAFINGLDSKIEVISGETEAAVEDIKVNGVSVVTDKVANVDLTPYALSSVVQTQVDNLETKVETISAATTPYSGASGVVVNDHTISLTGGHIVNDVSADTTYVSGSSLLAKFDGNPSNVVWGKFGFINNRRILDSDYNNFTLLENVSVPRGVGRVNVPIVDNAAQLPAGDSNVYGVVMVDNALFSGSTNPVQNKVVKAALDEKANGAYNLVALTQAEWEALTVKDPTTIYLIKE